MGETAPRILVVDAERHQLDTVCRGLHLHGYICQGAMGVEAALEAIAGGMDLVIVDLTTRDRAGVDLIERLRKGRPDLPIVAITGLAGERAGQDIPTLQKPFDADTLSGTVRRALGRSPGART